MITGSRFSVRTNLNDFSNLDREKKESWSRIARFFSNKLKWIEKKSNGDFDPGKVSLGVYELAPWSNPSTTNTSQLHVLRYDLPIALATEIKAEKEIRYSLFNPVETSLNVKLFDYIAEEVRRKSDGNFHPEDFGTESYILVSHHLKKDSGKMDILNYRENPIAVALRSSSGDETLFKNLERMATFLN